MDGGEFKLLQIGYDANLTKLYRETGSAQLTLAWMRSKRILAGSIGLNVIVVLLSIIALITVCRRRFELFSCVYLFILSMVSLATSALQIVNVIKCRRIETQKLGTMKTKLMDL